MRRILLPLLALCLGTAALAQGPVGMSTADDAKGWQGVGKLILGDRGFCTGALIGPKLVLTAAHCLFDKETGIRTPDSSITFQAGWRNGRAEAYRGVRRSVPHPDYAYGGEDSMERVAYDLAVLELDQPILLPQMAPFSTDGRPASGTPVSVVSYAQDRAEVPSIEQDCNVIASQASAMILTCNIDFGSSGAPVFALRDGVPRLVSVISAKAEYEGSKVAVAVPVETPLAVVMDEISRADSTSHRSTSGVGLIRGGDAGAGGGAGGGAKFVTP